MRPQPRKAETGFVRTASITGCCSRAGHEFQRTGRSAAGEDRASQSTLTQSKLSKLTEPSQYNP